LRGQKEALPGRNETEDEQAIVGGHFADEGEEWIVLEVGWEAKAEEVVVWYFGTTAPTAKRARRALSSPWSQRRTRRSGVGPGWVREVRGRACQITKNRRLYSKTFQKGMAGLGVQVGDGNTTHVGDFVHTPSGGLGSHTVSKIVRALAFSRLLDTEQARGVRQGAI
jgi:hypothetical protein